MMMCMNPQALTEVFAQTGHNDAMLFMEPTWKGVPKTLAHAACATGQHLPSAQQKTAVPDFTAQK